MGRQIAGFDKDERWQNEPERAVQAALGGPEKNARASLAVVRSVILAGGGVRRRTTIGVMAGVGVGRFDRQHGFAVLPTSVRMMPATAEHRVHRE